MVDDDSIMALASAAGRSGVAVVRVSGPAASEMVRRLTGREPPAPRTATLRALKDPDNGDLLDRALILFFERPESFTGEDVVEFHVHGGRAVIDSLFVVLRKLGLRFAEAGEFSRRAFQNGKMDLTQAEAIADLVDAETEAQRRQALQQADGALSRLYEDWRGRLLHELAVMEAWLDFPEDDLPEDLMDRISAEVNNLTSEISAHLDLADQGERVREGLHVVLAGLPNAGKSSLLNMLAGREAAIVSPEPGTTRDVVELALNIEGLPVFLSDTAGLRDAGNSVEQEGVRRAKIRYSRADVRVWLQDATVGPSVSKPRQDLPEDPDIVVMTKIDLNKSWRTGMSSGHTLGISTLTGEGFEGFRDALIAILRDRAFASAPPPNRARHRACLEDAIGALGRASQAPTLELKAEDIRQAMHAFGRLTGRVDVEDVLDIVFREFCIGK